MKIFYTSIVLTLLITFNACKSEDPVAPPDPIGTLIVKGTVLLNGVPVQGALVSIDDVLNWKSTTGSDGSFEITGISKGNHVISAKKDLEGGKVAFQSIPVNTQEPETNIGSIDLPQPISMNPIDNSQVTSNSIPLSWEKITSTNFSEYRIYRKDTPGLDEVTGKLIYSTSNADENSYIDTEFRTGRTYYYRVYAYFGSERFVGTNIVNTTVPEVNLVINNDFEVSSSGVLPDEWTQMLSGHPEFDYFRVVDDNSINGTHSLKVTYIDSLANPDQGLNPWGGLVQSIDAANLIAGEDYTISFWTRSEIGNMQVRILKNGDFDQPVLSYVIPNDQGWTEHRVNFRIDNETSTIDLWINTRSGFAVNGFVRGWIDNIKIIK